MITHKKVAEALGIAPRTVANILGGKAGYRYSEETRERVMKTAEELGYRSNRISRAIRLGRSNLIGIIHFGSMAEIARKTDALLPRLVNAAGYDYLAIDLNWHAGNVDRVLNELIEARVEGVVISHMIAGFGARETEMLAKVGIPAVVVYGDERLNIPVVCDDTRGAFEAMTRHLLEVGHKRLLLLANTYDARPTLQRIEGFQSALKKDGSSVVLDEAAYLSGKKHPEKGIVVRTDLSKVGFNPSLGYYRAAKRIFAHDSLPDAIVCTNDIAAFGVFTAAFEAGLKIPADIAITGCDNDLFGEFLLYGLTTIEKDIHGACDAAVKILIDLIQTGKTGDDVRTFSSKLVLRRSCGRSGIWAEEDSILADTVSTQI